MKRREERGRGERTRREERGKRDEVKWFFDLLRD